MTQDLGGMWNVGSNKVFFVPSYGRYGKLYIVAGSRAIVDPFTEAPVLPKLPGVGLQELELPGGLRLRGEGGYFPLPEVLEELSHSIKGVREWEIVSTKYVFPPSHVGEGLTLQKTIIG